jgi:ABC-type glycerol-3-phosphate transport system substrate-binding protein
LSSFISAFEAGSYAAVTNDWEAQVPPKWNADMPDSYQGTILNAGGAGINKFIDQPHKAAAKLWLDYVRSREATRYELVVEGNETLFKANYADPNLAQKVDWDLVQQAADELGIEAPPKVSGILEADVRGQMVKYAPKETNFPPGTEDLVDEVNEQFGKVTTGQATVDEAIESIQSLADQIR